MFSFTMSGQRFDFDETAEVSADDMFAFEDHVGIPIDDGTLEALGKQLEAGEITSRGIRAVVGLAWLAQRRAGGDVDWQTFCRTVHPATLQLVEDAPSGDGGPRRQSATRQRPKSRPAKK